MENTSVFVGEKLLKIEAESGLFEQRVNNVYLWQYVRFACLTKILEEITGVVTNSKTNGAIQQNEKEKWDLKEWLKKQQFLVHKKDIMVINHPRRVKEGGCYKCFVTDSILESLNDSYYVYENKYCGMHFKPVRTKNLKYIDIDILTKIFHFDEEQNRKQLHIFIKNIISTYERNCQIVMSGQSKRFISSHVTGVYKQIYYTRIWARIVLTLVRPKAVIVTVGYNTFVQGFIAEAKRRGIPTIELQHGRIGDTHIAYNYIYKGKIETFPDYMFVYGNYEKVTPRYPIDRTHVIAVGYPELEKKAYYYSKIKKNSNRKVMLFISGPADGKIVVKYALELRNNSEFKNMRMIYKLHPCEYPDWKKRYPQLVDSGLEIVADNAHDIYYYLGHADYVVGVSSTVLFEATEFDIQIFIIKDRDYRKSEALYQNDQACLVEDINQLIDKIGQSPERKQIVKTGSYFEKNSIKNIQNQLKQILFDEV